MAPSIAEQGTCRVAVWAACPFSTSCIGRSDAAAQPSNHLCMLCISHAGTPPAGINHADQQGLPPWVARLAVLESPCVSCGYGQAAAINAAAIRATQVRKAPGRQRRLGVSRGVQHVRDHHSYLWHHTLQDRGCRGCSMLAMPAPGLPPCHSHAALQPHGARCLGLCACRYASVTE